VATADYQRVPFLALESGGGGGGGGAAAEAPSPHRVIVWVLC